MIFSSRRAALTNMNQQSALDAAKEMTRNGMSIDDANVEIVRMMGFRTVTKLDRRTRSALMAAVKDGRIGRLPKKGVAPEVFFHPNSIFKAKEERQKHANAAIRAIANCFA